MQLEMSGFILLFIVLSILLSPFKKRNVFGCGLVGFSGVGSFDLNKIKFLLYWNSIERTSIDSTGIYTPKTGIVKDNVRAELFISNSKHIDKIKEDNLAIAHVRAKTLGVNNVKNAHPFEYDNIIGAHNGTLKNHWGLLYDYNMENVDYDVDSQILFSILSQLSTTDNKFKVLDEYTGAAALLFYNKAEEVLYACHDKERPLHYGYINGTDMYISSEKDILTIIGCSDVKSFPINKVHKIKDGVILETIDYNPKKEEDIEGRTAFHSDLKYLHIEGKSRLILADNIKGMTWSAFKPTMAVGFWVMIDTQIQAMQGGLKDKHWYYCDSVSENKYYNSQKLVLFGNNDEEVEVFSTSVDVTNFIPIKGGLVKVMYDLFGEKDRTKPLAKKGLIGKVVKFAYGDQRIEFKNPDTNRTIIAPLESVRVLSDAEIKAHNKNLINLEKAIKLESDIKALLEAPVLGSEDNINGNETPFIDTLPDKKEDLTPPVTEDSQEEYEDLIPYSLYCDLLDDLRGRLEKLKEEIDGYEWQKATDNIEDTLDILGKSYDLSYLENKLQE